jgi:hypothetical protein
VQDLRTKTDKPGGKMLLITNKLRFGVVSIVASISMTGCADTYRTLHLETIPEGAVITRADGSDPQISTKYALYSMSELRSHRVNGCTQLTGYIATWPSGAKTSTGLIPWCNLNANLDFTIERPKNAPNLEVDMQGGKNYRAQKRAEDAEYEKQQQAKNEYERLNPPPPPETSSEDDDDDIGMVGALTTIAGAYAATRSSSNHSTNNHATTAAMTSILTQNQQSNSQQYAVQNQNQNQDQDYERPKSNTANSNSGGGSFDYDSSHTQCVTYGRHPTLEHYAQYKNTCPYAVSVTYCGVWKNGQDKCSSRIFGSFDLKPGGTSIAEGSDISVKYIACKLPYRSIGSEVKISGGNLSAPCQKNK